MNKSSITLIVDDEPDIRELLELTLGRMDIDTKAAENIAIAKKYLTEYDFDMCLTDMKLPDGNGIELVEHMQSNYPDIPVAVITAHGNMELAIKALKAGAFDFVSKPVDLQILRNLVNTALKVSRNNPPVDRRSRNELLGESTVMKKTRAVIAKVSRSQAPIYISGESGSGKELVARLIHNKGPRSGKPFVPVNCGAIPSELMESEFFGHKKGSFTGATSDKDGLFQAANGGTLFFDEVADLPLNMQVKLLRAIQEKSVRPIGNSKEIPIDVRILSATHKNLEQLVQEGKFRQDLYYRINVIEVHVPPLRDHIEDVDQLVEQILCNVSELNGLQKPKLSDDALSAIKNYSFPGNVRELENILERATALCENFVIKVEDLYLPKTRKNGNVDPIELAIGGGVSLEQSLDNLEKQAIIQALEKTSNNKTAAAKLLGMSFRSFRYRLKKLGLD